MGRTPTPHATKEAVIKELADWLSEGKTLRDYCRQPGKPARRTVDDWREEDPEFAARIARARIRGADAIAEEALEIADTPLPGTITTEDKDGTKTVTEDMLGHRRLQVEARLKLLAKWFPQAYGDRQQVEHSGKVSLEQLLAETAQQAPPPKS